MLTCYKCGKGIAGKCMRVQPSNLALSFGDFPKSFHPACYERAEREAARLIGVDPDATLPSGVQS